MSLDGYIADRDGRFDWAAPDEEVHAFVNDLERSIGTYLYGRRMYETMAVWHDMPVDDEPPVMRDYAAIWRDAEKVVYSTSLERVSTPATTLERTFDADDVRQRKLAADRDLSIGGPTLAAHAFAAGLVDEYHCFIAPISVGGGTPSLPVDQVVELQLLDERRFSGGMVYLRYGIDAPA